jgi:Domain of unknown function (DUF4286)
MPKFVYAVWYDVDPSVEEEWEEWMSSKHVPEVVERGGFLGAKRYVVKEGGEAMPRHVTLYQAKDGESLKRYFEGPGAELREDYRARFGEKSRITRMILEETSSF